MTPCPKCAGPTKVLIRGNDIVKRVCLSQACDAVPFDVDDRATVETLPPDPPSARPPS